MLLTSYAPAMVILRSATEVFNTLVIALLVWYGISRIMDRTLDIGTKANMLKIYNNNMSAMLTFGKAIDFPGNMSKFTMHYDRGRMIRLGASMKILDYIL